MAEGGKVAGEQHCLWKLGMLVKVLEEIGTPYIVSRSVEKWLPLHNTLLFYPHGILTLWFLPTCSLLSLAMQPRKAVVGGPSS